MRKIFCILSAILLLTVAGCAKAEEKTVVTSFYPIYLLTKNLTQGIGEITVENLAAPDTGCLHDYQLLTGDMRILSGADVLLINGAGMESYLDTVLAQFPNLPVVDASQGITLLNAQGEQVTEHEGEESAAAEDKDHEHEENAHIWLDVKNAMQMVKNLRDGLKTALPEYAQAIEENAGVYLVELSALDDELRQGLSSLVKKDIITFHEAFPYFAHAYGLHVAAVVTHEPGEALSPAELADLVAVIRTNNVPPLFIEPQYPDLAAQTLAAETGVKVYSLDPLVTGPLNDLALTAYEDGMRKNLQVLLEALGQ